MNILLNRIPVDGPWGGGNLLVRAFCDNMSNLGHNIFHDFSKESDIIMLQDPRPGNTGISINDALKYKHENPDVKIIQRINECDARKNTTGVDQMLQECSKLIDATIFVSEWMKNYHLEKGWQCKLNTVIHNGVDLEHFKENKKNRNGKVNIVTHHWSDNIMKGFDIYEKLDEFVKHNDEYTFTYIGRHRNTFKNTNIVQPLFGQDLGKELSKYDVYVSASRFDPGPNHILESIACNLPTYVHKDGGGCIEFSGDDHVFDDYDALEKILMGKDFKHNEFKVSSWEKCIAQFDKFLNEVKNNEHS